jgi:hypothetical protein
MIPNYNTSKAVSLAERANTLAKHATGLAAHLMGKRILQR